MNYPHRLGRYTLVAPLGEGGMATVHVARRDGDPRVCVLKQLHGQLAEHEETNRRFHREAHIAAFLDHPGIAHVVDAGVEDGVFCIALEFIAGQTVEQMVKAARSRGGTLPFEVSIHVLLQALDALAHAHQLTDADGRSLGLVHRDLSPRNIMVGFDGRVKIIDFGIAKGRVDDHRTAVGVLMGTPYYMSPEQARAVELDHRSDIYTLGAVLFEMLTGHRLVTAKGRANILMSVVRDLAPALTSRNPHAPRELEPVLQGALAKDPSERLPSARAFHEALASAYEAGIERTRSGPPEARLHAIGMEQVGEFLRELVPDGEAQARALLDQVKEAVPVISNSEATRLAERSQLDGPSVDPTRLADPSLFAEPTRAAELAEVSALSEPIGEEPALEPTMFGLSPDRSSPPAGTTTTGAGSVVGWSPSRRASGARQRGVGAAVLAAVTIGAAVAFVTTRPPLEPPLEPVPALTKAGTTATSVDLETPSAAPAPAPRASAAPVPAPSTPVPAPSAGGSGPVTPSPAGPRPAASAKSPPAPAATGSGAEANKRAETSRSTKERARPERSAPPPAKNGSSAAAAELARLQSRLRSLRRQPSRPAALSLAEAVYTGANTHLAGAERARVLAEAERVMRTSSVDGMIEALDNAVSALRQGLSE